MRSLLVLSVGALAYALAQTMLVPALGVLARELDTDAAGVGHGFLATPVAVPEPSTLAMAGIAGMVGLGHAWRRRTTAGR